MDLIRLITALVWLEIIARIAGPKGHGPYLLGLTAAEPMTGFEQMLYASMDEAG